MKKNVLLMMCLIFFLTGCSAEYNIVIKKDSISEELQVYDENSYYESEIGKKIEEDINIKTGVLINEQNGDTEDVNPNYTYYLKEKINSKGKLGIKYTNTFDVDDYSKSYIANNCYKYFQVYKDKKYITISTSKEFLCIENFDKLYEVKINIKTKYNVEKNNADEVSNNVYSWTITKNNFSDAKFYTKDGQLIDIDIEKIKGNFKKWAETRDLEGEKITLDDVYAQYEQHIEKLPTNENIFANAFLETFRAMKRENETEARKMATEIVIFSLKERTKIGDRLSPETEEKAIRLSETWNAAGKEINLPEMTYYEGELIPWGWCKLPKVTQRGIQELPPPPTSTVEVPKNLPPVPTISISEIRDTIKDVRVSEVAEAREIIEESMKQVEEKSTEKKETETIEPEI